MSETRASLEGLVIGIIGVLLIVGVSFLITGGH